MARALRHVTAAVVGGSRTAPTYIDGPGPQVCADQEGPAWPAIPPIAAAYAPHPVGAVREQPAA